jgi:gamma-glutamylcyclotransferase (GGCT)/AIG2-like uncharacterized protein YtfP
VPKVSVECPYLFAYGTLMPDCVPAQMRSACRGIELVGRGTVRGLLYDLGSFPGVVEGDGVVRGVVLQVPQQAWAALDEYEACPGPEHPNGLFHRIKTRAKMENGEEVECWLYVYARDVSKLMPVASGLWERKPKID